MMAGKRLLTDAEIRERYVGTGNLNYDKSPELREPRKQAEPEGKRDEHGRLRDLSGEPMMSYPSMEEGGDPTKCQLRFRDGRVIQLDYPSIKHALLTSPYINFEGAILDGLDLSKIKIPNMNFKTASLRGTNLSGSQMINCDFSKAVLDGANCEGISARDSKFVGAHMDEETILKNADFSFSDLSNIEGFSRAEKEGIVIENITGLAMETVEKIVREEEFIDEDEEPEDEEYFDEDKNAAEVERLRRQEEEDNE